MKSARIYESHVEELALDSFETLSWVVRRGFRSATMGNRQ